MSQSGPPLPSIQQPGHERSGQRSSSLTAQKTITYDEVFDNVQREGSREKHFIIEWPQKSNKWYILRCEKHEKNFGENVFTSARSHLHSEAHGYVPRTKEHSIQELGVLVVGCDARRAKRSNLAYKKALEDGYKPKQGNMGPRKRKRHRSRGGRASKHVPNKRKSDRSTLRPSGQPRASRAFQGIIDPIPGEVYQGALRIPGRSELHWYLVVCLPLDNW
jgi:hypothetical protein